MYKVTNVLMITTSPPSPISFLRGKTVARWVSSQGYVLYYGQNRHRLHGRKLKEGGAVKSIMITEDREVGVRGEERQKDREG